MGMRVSRKYRTHNHRSSHHRPKNQGFRRTHKKRHVHRPRWENNQIFIRKKPFRSSRRQPRRIVYRTHHWTINNLDDACLLNIFKYLPPSELLIMTLVCKKWHSLCELMLSRDLSIFNINDEDYWSSESGAIIDVQRCKRIFSASRPLLIKVNLSLDKKFVSLSSRSVSFSSLCRCPLKSPISSRGLNQFPLLCSRITELTLCQCMVNVTDDYLERLFKNNPNIQCLSLTGFKLSGSCFSSLSQKFLHTFILSTCEFRNLDLSLLTQKFPRLHTLSLCDTKISEAHNFDTDDMSPPLRKFHEISSLSYLTVLILSSSTIYDSDLYLIATQCTGLIVVDIAFCLNIFSTSFQKVNNLPKLKCLNMCGIPNLFDEDLLFLSRNLRTLDISHHVNFTEQGLLKMLSRLPYIEKVEMAHCNNVSDDFLSLLVYLCDLRLNDVILEVGCFGTDVEIFPDDSLFLTVILNDSVEIDYDDYVY